LAALIKTRLGVDAVLTPGGGGIFDVVVDGDLAFSKFESYSFPDEDALVSRIAGRDGAAP
jgi:predicted Rdx family selenoprotein